MLQEYIAVHICLGLVTFLLNAFTLLFIILYEELRENYMGVIAGLNFCDALVLVFSKCFRAGFYTFSRLKFKESKGTNLCNLCFKIKTKTYLVFISMLTICSACHC